jgi:hypothetical protein
MSTFFDKTKVQASQIYAEAYDFVTQKFNQAGKIFTLASAYGQILSVISQLSSMILFFIEDSITELNILTASRTQSIQGLARLTGHNPTRAIAATGEISFAIKNVPSIQGDQIIIPNFTRIKCLNNNKIYTIILNDDQLRVSLKGNQVYYANVIQGEIQVQFFTGDGAPLQSYTAVTKGSVLIDNFYVKVYINGQLWTKYDSIYDIPRNAKGFLVKTGISGGIDVYFGNENFGMMPPSGSEIRIEYLLTSGESGNLREGDSTSFQWIDFGYTFTGDEVNLNTVLQTDMGTLITFGSNPESTELTRLIAPMTSRSYVLANPDNYVVFLQKFNYFSVIKAYTTFGDQYLDDDNVIYLFLIPDITKRLQNGENYFTVPSQYFELTSQEQTKVLNLIEDSGSKIVTTVVKIVQPILKKYVLNISIVVFEGYSQDVVKNIIISQLSDYFLSVRRRDTIPQSDLVKIIENVEGVDSVNVNFLSEANEVSKLGDPAAAVIGLDELGNILIGSDELPIIRGGWKDRNGIYYADGIYTDKPCSVNIAIKGTSKVDVNSLIFQNSIDKIMKQ